MTPQKFLPLKEPARAISRTNLLGVRTARGAWTILINDQNRRLTPGSLRQKFVYRSTYADKGKLHISLALG